MKHFDDIDEERIGELLRALPAPPPGWVAAAKELPRTMAELGDAIGRIEADEAFAAEVRRDVHAAIARHGLVDDAATRAALTARFAAPDA